MLNLIFLESPLYISLTMILKLVIVQLVIVCVIGVHDGDSGKYDISQISMFWRGFVELIQFSQ